ncbi:cytochrome c oxidase assembly protein [Micromonospora yasonensis]|uniref:cytochrome c oxidase assembly protein n=1 Tax=Micromonospora yasonensis TaxID=1128667 RepID=UPI00222E9370|nr:cytochrome c oxidase assembly protein [Micromonospora yasonensis]MCW3844770.1 cytochrome c oxidase assembly protein [Micromonospora yasonensis]
MPALTATGPTGGDDVGAGLLAMLLAATLALLAAGYGRGAHELWARRGLGRVLPGWRVAAFGAGLLSVLAAQDGPLAAAAQRSFAGHMTQHMLLLLGAGPLLAAGAAGLPLTLACPAAPRRWLARLRAAGPVRWLRRPAVLAFTAGGIQTVVLWFWHLPGPYLAAEQQPVVHAVEHACFLGSAWLLWAPLLGAPRHRLPAPAAVLLLIGTMLPASALGAVLTFAPRPIYPVAVLGPDPLADQQLAGLLMWAPMDVAVLVASLTVFLRWLVGLQRQRPERVTSPESRSRLPARPGRVVP